MRGFGVIVISNFYFMKKLLRFLSNRRLLRGFWPFALKIQKYPQRVIYFLKATVVAYSKIYNSLV